jgi:repressor LexA
MAITPKQKRFIEFIDDFRRKQGHAPSQTEIARHFGFRSLGTVQKYLTRLREQGLLEKAPAHARRGLAVKPPQTSLADSLTVSLAASAKMNLRNPVTLPLLGRVAAGQPIEAIETPDQIEVPSSLIQRGEHFVLQVSGNSMIEDGILDGDFVIIKKQRTAERGQMIVALVDDAATVKRFHPKKDLIELHPANPLYHPIVVKPDQSFQIEGIVAGVIRKLN